MICGFLIYHRVFDFGQVAATLTDAAREQAARRSRAAASGAAGGPAAAEQFHSEVSQLRISPNDKWAMLIAPGAVHVFDLESLAYHGQLPAFEVCTLIRPLPKGINTC